MMLDVEKSLKCIIDEISVQSDIGKTFPVGMQEFSKQVAQIREFNEYAGEYSLAYEYIVCLLESFPFTLTGPNAVKLLEVGLTLRFKSERKEDVEFDSRA